MLQLIGYEADAAERVKELAYSAGRLSYKGCGIMGRARLYLTYTRGSVWERAVAELKKANIPCTVAGQVNSPFIQLMTVDDEGAKVFK